MSGYIPLTVVVYKPEGGAWNLEVALNFNWDTDLGLAKQFGLVESWTGYFYKTMNETYPNKLKLGQNYGLLL